MSWINQWAQMKVSEIKWVSNKNQSMVTDISWGNWNKDKLLSKNHKKKIYKHTTNPQTSPKNEQKKRRKAYLRMILSNKIDKNSENHLSSFLLSSPPPASPSPLFPQACSPSSKMSPLTARIFPCNVSLSGCLPKKTPIPCHSLIPAAKSSPKWWKYALKIS